MLLVLDSALEKSLCDLEQDTLFAENVLKGI